MQMVTYMTVRRNNDIKVNGMRTKRMDMGLIVIQTEPNMKAIGKKTSKMDEELSPGLMGLRTRETIPRVKNVE